MQEIIGLKILELTVIVACREQIPRTFSKGNEKQATKNKNMRNVEKSKLICVCTNIKSSFGLFCVFNSVCAGHIAERNTHFIVNMILSFSIFSYLQLGSNLCIFHEAA